MTSAMLWHGNGIRDNGLALQVMEDAGKFGRYYDKGMPEGLEKMLLFLACRNGIQNF